MPTYQYVCTACSTPLEVQQSFSDEPLSECPTCQGRLRKVFSAVGVVFKGSGFYRTDSRPAAAEAGTSPESASTKDAQSGDGASGAGGDGTKKSSGGSGDQKASGSTSSDAKGSGSTSSSTGSSTSAA